MLGKDLFFLGFFNGFRAKSMQELEDIMYEIGCYGVKVHIDEGYKPVWK